MNFSSGLEERVANQLNDLNAKYTYENLTIFYKDKLNKTRKYKPDFQLSNGIIIETKGKFPTVDRRKHKLIRQQHNKKYDIRFVFSNPFEVCGKKTKTTYAMWCDLFDFKWSSLEIPKEWIFENDKV